MKKITTMLAAAIISSSAISKNESNNQTNTLILMEKQNIINAVSAIFNGSDERKWSKVENSFAPEVTLDYTSMTGGTPVKMTPIQITEAWNTILPGFQSTHHQIGNFKVDINGNAARVHNRGLALHYLPNSSENNVWVVVGTYEFTLSKDNAHSWKVNSMKFNLQRQEGNLELPALAKQKVKEGASFKYASLSESNKSVIEKFFTSLEKMNISSFLTVWADNGKQLMPMSPDNFPKELNGKDAIYNQYKGLPENYASMKFPRKYFPTEDPNKIIVQYTGTIPLRDGGEYNNNYVGIFKLEDGKLQQFTEYFDPFILQQAFGQKLTSNFNVNGDAVTTQKVEFQSEGLVLKGLLHLPPNFDSNKKYRAVIVTGSWTTVKEQMPELYAKRFADSGFIALTFDFRFFGESEGQPREYENPTAKIKDIQNAVTYLTTLPYVNGDALAGVGVCASTGYMSYAAASDSRIKTLVLLAPWLHDAELVEKVYGGRPGGVNGLIERGEKAKKQFEETGKTTYVVAASTTDPYAAMYISNPIFDYYLNPAKGAIPQWKNDFAEMSWKPWLTFDGIAASKSVKQPVLIVHTEKGAIPDGAKEFYNQLQGEKKFVWINSKWNQLDMYYQPEAINEAVTPAIEWLDNMLK